MEHAEERATPVPLTGMAWYKGSVGVLINCPICNAHWKVGHVCAALDKLAEAMRQTTAAMTDFWATYRAVRREASGLRLVKNSSA